MTKTRTLNLKPDDFIMLFEIVANKWATAVTFAAIPCAERVWNFPAGVGLSGRLKWSNGKTAEARRYANTLSAFGVKNLPTFDWHDYVKPYNSPAAQPGDLNYSYGLSQPVRAAMVAAILASVSP